MAAARTATTLAAGGWVVVDDTASPRFLRDGWRQLAERVGAPVVLLHVDVQEAVVWERARANRVRPTRPDVTDDVMREHLASFEPPEDDERALVVRAGALAGAGLVEAVRSHLGRVS